MLRKTIKIKSYVYLPDHMAVEHANMGNNAKKINKSLCDTQTLS
jgi:hypothetical protein